MQSVYRLEVKLRDVKWQRNILSARRDVPSAKLIVTCNSTIYPHLIKLKYPSPFPQQAGI
jgi:hypothetical protein